MFQPFSRRRFLQNSVTASLASSLARPSFSASDTAFSFVLLGDLHYDQLVHHDFQWLDRHHPGDLPQIQNYSRLTSEVMPAVFRSIRSRMEPWKNADRAPAFVIQVGDLVEGLCGSEELAVKQNREAVAFVEQADLGIPFLFTKGNHDVTGDGATEAFRQVLQPFMEDQSRRVDPKKSSANANHHVRFADCEFAFFDAYDKSSLEWFEAMATKRTARRFFVVVHPPVVPYGARATWYLFSDAKSAAKRDKMLELLGQQEAIVLGGHLHKFSTVTRQVQNQQFTQLAISSVVSAVDEQPRAMLQGLADYSPEQVNLEPRHAPTTIEQRRSIYESERKHVTAFQYANTAGFAVVTVDHDRVDAAVYAGTSEAPFRNVQLA